MAFSTLSSSTLPPLPTSVETINFEPSSINVFGYELPNHRYTNFHIINFNRTWSPDLARFPGFQNSFPFEDVFLSIGNDVQVVTKQYWPYCFHLSVAYLFVIFVIQSLMRNRPAFNLRMPLVMWNIFLAIFSIVGVYRCMPEFISILTNEGVTASYTKSSYYHDYRLSVWYLFFTLSKAIELIDTLFVVLRKSKLITLHWIHHVLTLIFAWFAFVDVPATARWMVNMNFCVHSLMYTYYALKALRFNIPRQVNLTITTLQVVQMFAGLYINYECLKRKILGFPVDISYSTASTSFALYFIFALLFCNFFIRTYILSSKRIQMFSADINHNHHYKGFVKKLQ